MTFDDVRTAALALPGAEEGTSYGTPAFKVRGKLFARLKEDGETLAVKIDHAARDVLLQTDPSTFFVTDHYVNYPMVLIRLASVHQDDLRTLLEGGWRMSASKTLIAAFDRARAT